jgi:hypothetical protein
LGDIRRDIRYEAGADVASLKDDVRELGAQAKSAPNQVQGLWNDVRIDLRILEADVTIHARFAARRIATLIKTS